MVSHRVPLAAAVVGLCVGLSATLAAHATRTASIDVVEMAPGEALLHVRTEVPDDRVTVSVEAPCRLTPVDDASRSGPRQQTQRLSCPGDVAGATLRVDGLGPIVTQAIVLHAMADGRSGSSIVRASSPVIVLPRRASAGDVAQAYLVSGAWHIVQGYDHLLFLLLLVLHLRSLGAVLLAETAFTLSHSLSFSATALGWLHVSPLAAEACIALSLVLMALDIRPGQAAPARRGAGMALVFGLVHGLGFAGALAEFGLPDHDVALALAAFAGGVELGQVAVLAAALTALQVARSPRLAWTARLEPVALSVIGGVSMFWCFERVARVFAARG